MNNIYCAKESKSSFQTYLSALNHCMGLQINQSKQAPQLSLKLNPKSQHQRGPPHTYLWIPLTVSRYEFLPSKTRISVRALLHALKHELIHQQRKQLSVKWLSSITVNRAKIYTSSGSKRVLADFTFTRRQCFLCSSMNSH